jgi:DNA-binding MarR family transcriptional regulator
MADESLAAVLTRALDEVSRRVEEITGPEGLSLPQWLVLRALAVDGPHAMRGLVTETRLDDSTLTRVVDRLATLGLVYREADPSDRRRVLVSASARGKALHEGLAPAVAEAERDLLASDALAPLTRPHADA